MINEESLPILDTVALAAADPGSQTAQPLFARVAQDLWRPDPITRGPFEGMQGGAAAALMCARIEALAKAEELGHVSALTTHFLKPVPLDEIAVSVTMLRRGRRVSVIDASLEVGGKLYAVQRATVINPLPNESYPEPADQPVDVALLPLEQRPSFHGQPWLMDAMEARLGSVAWFRLKRQIVEGAGAMSAMLPAADFAHGIQLPIGAKERLPVAFPNPDVTVQLFRSPRGHWVGVESETAWSREGRGAGWGALHDEFGLVGRVAMSVALTPLGL